ncbi:hypothetical protein A6U97_02795 [Agrobacterium tumefaciens]|uniref:hypothetical protein n=1 Tax=Agrobacterium tumefaciens TaxID=358 RepID=UPI00080F7C5C|nr:hypothetical protein A6U97_02795 [Agrobacterium tumefaciens]
MAGKPNAAELEMLTDEEREGLLDDDTVDEGLEDGTDADDDAAAAADDKTGEGAGQEGKDKPDAAEGDDEDDAGAEGADTAADAASKAKQDAEAKAAADAAAAEAAASGVDKNAAASAAAEPKPLEGDKRPSWVLDPKVPEQIDALEKQKDELTDKFDDGEFTGKEFRAEMRKIDAQLDALKEQRISSNVARNTAIIEYRDVTIPTFLSEHPEYKPGSVLHHLLDAEVKQLQMQSNNPFNPAILERAHQNISEQVAKAYGAKPAAQAKPKAAAAAREVVPTLGTVPAADANDTDGGGEFAWLDRLANADVEKYEQELAKLSDEKRERYLAE